MDNAFAYWLNTTHGDDTEVICLRVSVNVRVCVCVRVCGFAQWLNTTHGDDTELNVYECVRACVRACACLCMYVRAPLFIGSILHTATILM